MGARAEDDGAAGVRGGEGASKAATEREEGAEVPAVPRPSGRRGQRYWRQSGRRKEEGGASGRWQEQNAGLEAAAA